MVENCVQLDRGAQKTGYKFTDRLGYQWVVKEDTGGYNNPSQRKPPNLKKYGCDTITQWQAGGWIIQEFVTPLRLRGNATVTVPYDHPAWRIYTEISNHEFGDYHDGNFGIRADGSLVCFDW